MREYTLEMGNGFFLEEYPYFYQLSLYLAKSTEVEYIIHISPHSLVSHEANFKNIINININRSELLINIPHFSDEMLSKSMVVIANTLEYITNIEVLINFIARASCLCKCVQIATPDRIKRCGLNGYWDKDYTRQWSMEELYNCFIKRGIHLDYIGYTSPSSNSLVKNTLFFLTGVAISYKKVIPKKTAAIINVYNEKDVIVEVINHLLEQGVDVIAIDNWSNDGSFELLIDLYIDNSRVTIKRFPESKSTHYEWGKLLENLQKESIDSKYDWIIHHDSDELRYSPWKNATLADAISFVDSMGYNAIDFTVLDFRPVMGEVSVYNNYEKKIGYYEFGKRPGHFIQIKAWKNTNDVEMKQSGGHEAVFPNRKVYPIKFLLKHYPLRNELQANKKIFRDRLDRILPEEREKGWHFQYNKYLQTEGFTLWNKDTLNYWSEVDFEMYYIIERISGIGIIQS
ncbi:glycosyltransferase family 2 protein [Paenibacillus sp. YYML68]|uniref:glycosyltransferase family 2 protein n=1 Tax=Paenibacillus sp. YYML68 TaxID=2909250 RepID=UPI00248FF7F9|nr:glycosyltransferase family 2 protein [Paenibacillus sp. YYML68]